MIVVTEAEATTIRAAFEHELAAAVELRRLFPGVADMAEARDCARTIAGWKPLRPRPPRQMQSRRRQPHFAEGARPVR
jgi:hypothetical protein